MTDGKPIIAGAKGRGDGAERRVEAVIEKKRAERLAEQDARNAGVNAPDRAALIAAADKHADNYEGHDIPANETRAAIRNAFVAGSQFAAGVPVDHAADLDNLLTRIINRRVTIEQRMFDAAAGKRPMPTPDELREWAVYLGTPTAGVRLGDTAALVKKAGDLGMDLS
jgi:hypothetical protein